jgi:hypothetical protein
MSDDKKNDKISKEPGTKAPPKKPKKPKRPEDFIAEPPAGGGGSRIFPSIEEK